MKEDFTRKEELLIMILFTLIIFTGAYIADKYFPLCKCI